MDVAFTSAATRQMRKLPQTVRAQIEAKLLAYLGTGRGDVRALKGGDGFRLRSGDYRIIFTREADTVIVRAVGHRREIYD